jgi:hypothetical protein
MGYNRRQRTARFPVNTRESEGFRRHSGATKLRPEPSGGRRVKCRGADQSIPALSSYSAEAETSYLTWPGRPRRAPGLVRSKYSIAPPAVALSGRISRRPGSHGDRPDWNSWRSLRHAKARVLLRGSTGSPSKGPAMPLSLLGRRCWNRYPPVEIVTEN